MPVKPQYIVVDQKTFTKEDLVLDTHDVLRFYRHLLALLASLLLLRLEQVAAPQTSIVQPHPMTSFTNRRRRSKYGAPPIHTRSLWSAPWTMYRSFGGRAASKTARPSWSGTRLSRSPWMTRTGRRTWRNRSARLNSALTSQCMGSPQ